MLGGSDEVTKSDSSSSRKYGGPILRLPQRRRCCMLDDRDGVGGGLRPRMGDHGQLAGRERREHLLALGEREQDPLTG